MKQTAVKVRSNRSTQTDLYYCFVLLQLHGCKLLAARPSQLIQELPVLVVPVEMCVVDSPLP
jgi:hypothetical protein